MNPQADGNSIQGNADTGTTGNGFSGVRVLGIEGPSISQFFSESCQSPPGLGPGTGSLPVEVQEDLLSSLQVALRAAELTDNATFEGMQEALYKLWDCRSDYTIAAAETLANGSRNPSFRLAYGRAGILEFFLKLVASREALDSKLILHSLRLIGNSCADTNENRATVIEGNYIFAILQHLLRPDLIQVVVPVIYNLCIDFEPAQFQLATNGIVYILLKLVADGAFRENDALLGYVYELLELIGEQEQGVDKSPDGTLSLLIFLLVDKEVFVTPAEFATLANCLVAYLENKRFQDLCVSKNMVAGVLSVLQHSLSIELKDSEDDEIKALTQSQLKINQVLAELSSSPLFAELYPIDSPLSQTLKSWLGTTDSQLQICGCIMLGNLARSDEVCNKMVRELNIHRGLIAILNSDARGAVLHSALGFLKNLALASDNRQYLGEAGLIPTISRLWGYETVPQVQLAATSIARQLIVSSMENINRLLEPLPSQQKDSAHKQTYMSVLISLFEKSDSTPIKTEIGRIVASICRTLVPKSRGNDAEAEAKILLESLFELHEHIAYPIGAMITQTQWPVVRSEGWFALALMASNKLGSVAAIDCLEKIDGLPMIEETLAAQKPGPDGELETPQPTKDRENMIVLVQEILKNDTDTLPGTWKNAMQDLMSNHISNFLTSCD